jgi:tetratricopeptide (TPR) repeat protein
MMQTYRIFVSSPGDAQFERQRVDRVVARLNGELAGAARFVTVRWETEFYRADRTFQAQIPSSTDCNIVVAIFRARLGTELPPDFARLPDGDRYPSGTAYEVLTAIAKRQSGSELPDVFVFRCPDPPLVRIDDEAKEDEIRGQWSRLKAFFARWFLTQDGHFKAAFQTFVSTDDFENQLEQLLRDWLRHRLAKGGTIAWPIATMGSPYPGLLSFGPRYAPVFFGRARDTARAVEAWSEAGRRGMPFLVVVGASGSGKSSLARAGLVPRLTTPGVVETVDAWRVAALRPGDSPDGPVVALAHALMQSAADLPKAEEGRLPALPEIATGDYGTPAELAALLTHGDAAAVKPILAALDKVGEQERRAQAIEKPVRCDLVILIDQLDELFAAAIDTDMRQRFGAILERLLASGRVWVVTTLRADLYELFLKDEVLFRLKDKGVAYDLVPPALADMAEAVRGPARAAGLTWEADPTTKEPLDDRLIRDIDRPDLLPIVQFVLDRLFQQRLAQDGRVVLSYAAYQALGTLDGAIDTAAEAALAPLGPAATTALPRLVRSLVVYAGPATGAVRPTPALRQAPLAAVVHDDASQRLVVALVNARILVSGRDQADGPVVALAHQRVIEAWGRARDVIGQSADLLRVREELEDARRRWEAAGKRNDLLIPPGLQLSEAENAAGALKDELPAATHGYVEKSARSARRRQRLTAAAAAVFLALAVGAGFLGIVAQNQKLRAEQAADEALNQSRQAETARAQADQQRQQAETARQQAETARKQADAQRQQAEDARRLAENRRQQAEMRLAAADELLDGNGKAEQLRQCLASTARASAHPPPPGSREFFVGRWHVDQGFGSTDVDWRADGTCESKNIFSGSVHALDLKNDVCTWQFQRVADNEFVIDYRSTQLGDNFPKRLRFKIVNPIRIHNIDFNYDAFRIVCPGQELELYRNDLATLQQHGGDVGDLGHQHDLADAFDRIGDVLMAQGEYAAALEEFAQGMTIRRGLALSEEGNQTWQRDLSNSDERIGMVRQMLKQNAEALEAYRAGLAIRQKLNLANRGNFTAQHDLAAAYERVAAMLALLEKDRKPAREAYGKALQLRLGLADANLGNVQLWSELVTNLYFVSTVSEAAEAKQFLKKAVSILEVLEREQKLTPEMANWPGHLRAELAKLP